MGLIKVDSDRRVKIELLLNLQNFEVFVPDHIGIVNGLCFEQFILNNIGESLFPINIILILLFPGSKICHQPIQLPFPLPDNTLNILILDPILFYSLMNIVDVGLKPSQLNGLFSEFMLLLQALVVYSYK